MWDKLGLVYVAKGEQEWATSHAYVPTTIMLDEETIRVYVSFLDQEKVGRGGYVDVAASNPLQVLKVSRKPVLDIGTPGSFDDNGVTPISLVRYEDKLYLYYIGWQLGVKVRYFLFTGLAISSDGGETFIKYSKVPILDRAEKEHLCRSGTNVLFDEGVWKMWYIAGDRWIDIHGKKVPTYNLRYLESSDGINWGKQGKVCIDFANDDEYGFGRPFVVKESDCYKMWYSIRTASKGYRLGYAESIDGLIWERKDEFVGIDVSETGWDSQMICMGCVQKTKYGTYLFYNGNNFGETGFGVAVLRGG
jgi:predicted GH43/DUF377 family glycosyl hydrolase